MTFIVRLRRTLRHSFLSRYLKWHQRIQPFRYSLILSLIIFALIFIVRSHSSISTTTLASVIHQASTTFHYPGHPPPSSSSSDSHSGPHHASSPHSHQDQKSGYEPLLSRVDAIVGEGHLAKKVLVDVYALPDIVVSNMTQHVAIRLYWKLVYTDVVRALRFQQIDSPSSSATSSSMTLPLHPHATVLFVHAQNGLGNRLRAIASGIAIARSTHRVPVIIWQRDAHLGALLTDIFDVKNVGSDINTVLYRDLIVMEDFPVWSQIHRGSTYWQSINYMQKDGLGAESDQVMRFEPPTDSMSLSQPPSNIAPADAIHAVLHAPPLQARPIFDAGLIRFHQHVYFKSGYVANVSPTSLSSRRVVNLELRSFQPISSITSIVSKFDQNRLQHSYGIHIRSRTLANDNVAVDNNCEYTQVGAFTTDYWRSRSQLPVFIHKINQKIRLRKDATFFVAADDRNIIKSLKELYPGRIDSIDRDCDDRDASCVIYAMADLICLSKTRRLYGSNWSSFSEVAGRLTNRRLYLSGKDFGRPKKNWTGSVVRNVTMFPIIAWKLWISFGNQYSSCESSSKQRR